MKEVVVIGAAAVDLIAKVKRFPKPDEIVPVDAFDKYPGGSLANIAVGLARLGVDTGFVGKVGNDENGKLLLEEFKKENVDVSRVIISEGYSAATFIAVNEEGERIIFALGGKALLEKPEELPMDYILDSKLLVVGEIFPHVARALIMGLKDKKIKIVYSPGGVMISLGFDFVKDMIANCDVLILSEKELISLVGTGKDFDVAADFLLNMGAKKIIITRGPLGSIMFTREKKYIASAYKVTPVDTTGAGDAYTAGLVLGILREYDDEKTLGYATACAAIAITKIGARTALPRLDEVIDFIKEKGFPEIKVEERGE
ncbi:MAG: carbohydrate kinase family protein [Candidatus Asgardarchaeia archaeon]